jgi:UDP-N-acetylmuramoyl-L-alanyl-D-glutamate--2,6-diaminopimelate ligase
VVRKLKNWYHFLVALLAVVYYYYPARKLTVIGVTGTDGKTTTVNLIYHLLTSAGLKAGMISTIRAKIGEKKVETDFHVTTPNSIKVQRLIHSMANQGIQYLVLEATSHGLDQHRLLGCNFKIGVITNVTHEHLDYHKTYKNYLKAKAKLFHGVEHAVLNADDYSYGFLKQNARKAEIISYKLKGKADLTLKTFPFKTKLPGEYNQTNCLAAIAVGRIIGLSDQVIKKAMASFPPIKGRLEEVKVGQSFKVLVDFAHTPGAFEKVIPTVRQMTSGKIIHVFGCTGDRDKSKRPVMGETAARLSDKIILTHEDTYSEDPEKIISEIEPGVKKGGKVLGKSYWKVSDRKQAIRKAVNMAKKGDAVLLTGVGHQTTLNIGGQEVPWSDQEEARKAIKEKLSA